MALLLSYDGTDYHGWQVQKYLPTVCQTIQDALRATVGHPVTLHGCGRTDAGVHAGHYVASFQARTRIPAERLPYALTSLLPQDISVSRATDVPEDFHAINSCWRKEYTYHMYTGALPDALLARYALFHSDNLDIESMRTAARDFEGTHDFASLRSMGSTQVKSTVRHVYSSELITRGRHVFFRVAANGFLYNMVRAMMGTLLYIGLGKLPADGIPALLSEKNRTEAGPTVPPHGLYMTGVWYDTPLPWTPQACGDPVE